MTIPARGLHLVPQAPHAPAPDRVLPWQHDPHGVERDRQVTSRGMPFMAHVDEVHMAVVRAARREWEKSGAVVAAYNPQHAFRCPQPWKERAPKAEPKTEEPA